MQQTKEIPIVEIKTGDVFLQDAIADEKHCYICKKLFNKYDDQDMLLLRAGKGKMVFCCPSHSGVVRTFIEQYGTMPGGWERYNEKVDMSSYNNVLDNKCLRSRPPRKIKKRRH